VTELRSVPARLEIDEPPFDLGDTGRDYYAKTQPVAFGDPRNGWAWARYCAALSILLDPVSTMVRDDDQGNPGWTALASPNRCPSPWLRVLAQWAGIRRWDAIDDVDLRNLIGPRSPGLWRGTRAAMAAAVRRFLPPDGTIYLEERAGGDAYAFRVFTYDFDEHDPALVEAALLAAKPAGLTLIYEVRSGQTYRMVRERHPTYADARAAYVNYEDMRLRRPIPSGGEEPDADN
jgi:hypothetical protein